LASTKRIDRVQAVATEVAQAMATAMESNPSRWTQPWSALGAATPHNPVSEVIYNGINRWVLTVAGVTFGDDPNAWATYRQWQQVECQVRRGMHGVYIIRPMFTRCCKDRKCRDGDLCGNSRRLVGITTHTVFHHTQVDGEVPQDPRFTAVEHASFEHEEIDRMFDTLGATREYGGDEACYTPETDRIRMPKPEQFFDVGGYASTMAHEYAHWTGHPSRLNRFDESTIPSREERAFEELTAELGSVIICNALGMEHEPPPQHAAYLTSWTKALKGDNGAAIMLTASSQATKAAAWIVNGIQRGLEQGRPTPATEVIVAQQKPTNVLPQPARTETVAARGLSL